MNTPHPDDALREALARAIRVYAHGPGSPTWDDVADNWKAVWQWHAYAALSHLRALPLADRLRAVGIDPETHAVVPRECDDAILLHDYIQEAFSNGEGQLTERGRCKIYRCMVRDYALTDDVDAAP